VIAVGLTAPLSNCASLLGGFELLELLMQLPSS
jgi:hypothetical protein